MNILVISHTYIAPINRDKWKVLAKQYQHVRLTVVVPKTWPTHLFTHQAGDLTQEQEKNITFVSIKTFCAGNEVRYGYDAQALARVIIACNPEVIQVEQGDNAFSFFQTIMLTKLLGINASICFFTWVNWKPYVSFKYRFTWGLVEKINRFFSCGAITGNHDAQIILQEKGFYKPMMVIPQLGVTENVFVRPSRTIGSEKKYIGFLGRITEEKGVMHLVQAFNNIAAKYPDWELIFVGNGAAKKMLLDYIHQHGLTDRVTIKPSVSHHEVAQVFQELDIFVLPSYDTPLWREQFGHVLIEAMAGGVPILASDAGEIPYVVGDAGLIFKQRDVVDLQAFLEILMQNPELRQGLAKRGYERVLEHYTHEKIAQKTYQFWTKLF